MTQDFTTSSSPEDRQGQDQIMDDGIKTMRDNSGDKDGPTKRKSWQATRMRVIADVDDRLRRRTVQRDKDDKNRPFDGCPQPLQVTYRRHRKKKTKVKDAGGQAHVIESSLVEDAKEKYEQTDVVHGLNRSTIMWGVPKKGKGKRKDKSGQNENIPFGRSHDMMGIRSFDPGGTWKWAHNITPPPDRGAGDPDPSQFGIPYSKASGQSVAPVPPTHSGGFVYDNLINMVSNWALTHEIISLETAHILTNKDAQHMHVLAMRHDCQVRRQQRHGRIFFTSGDPGIVGTIPFMGEMIHDVTLKNLDTSIGKETGEWRPLIKLSRDTSTPNKGDNFDASRARRIPEDVVSGIATPIADQVKGTNVFNLPATIGGVATPSGAHWKVKMSKKPDDALLAPGFEWAYKTVIPFTTPGSIGLFDAIKLKGGNKFISANANETIDISTFGSIVGPAFDITGAQYGVTTAFDVHTKIHNVTSTSPAAKGTLDSSSHMWFHLFRDPTDAADTFLGDLYIIPDGMYAYWYPTSDPTVLFANDETQMVDNLGHAG